MRTNENTEEHGKNGLRQWERPQWNKAWLAPDILVLPHHLPSWPDVWLDPKGNLPQNPWVLPQNQYENMAPRIKPTGLNVPLTHAEVEGNRK